jgi:hypothetical protein
MPYAEFLLAANGTFYGSTASTGGGGYGTIFNYSPNVVLGPTLTPDPLTFTKKQPVGTTSTAKSVKITNVNTGTATLDLTGFAVSGPFAISTNNCVLVYKGALPAGKACRVLITFTPTATGPATGTLTISDNAPNSPQTVTLTGTGN